MKEERGTLAERVSDELAQSTVQLSSTRGQAVAIFGGARVKPDSTWYNAAHDIAEKLSATGYHIISGGGPGIMEAANKGARLGNNGLSIGLNIKLPFEKCGNDYQDVSLEFDHFAARKIAFCRHAAVFIVMPGGYGTIDELGEILTMVQCGKMSARGIVLYDSQFWGPMLTWFKDTLLVNGLISAKDLDLMYVADEVDSAVEHAKDFLSKLTNK